jgi:hypothetical protein
MAFSPYVVRDSVGVARTRRELPRAAPRRFVRHSALGTQAIYEIVEESRELVTAEVLEAPGLAPGTRVRMLASAARAMDEVEPAAVAQLDGRRAQRQAAADLPPRAA